MQIKATVSYHLLTPRRTAAGRNKHRLTGVHEDVEKPDTCARLAGMGNGAATVGNSPAMPPKIKHRCTM